MNHMTNTLYITEKSKHLALIAQALGEDSKQNWTIAEQLMTHFGGLKGIADADPNVLKMVSGMTPYRIQRIISAFKLGRCLFEQEDSPSSITTPTEAYHYLAPFLSGLIHEELHALFLNRNKTVLLHRRLSSGSSHMTVVDPKQVLYYAIVMRASGIILAHNHPSGNPKPSQQDIAITSRVEESAQLLGLNLLDHLIIGGDGYVSMAEVGFGFASSGDNV